MPKFRSLSSEHLSLFALPGEFDAFAVEPGQVVDLPGEVAGETDDAYVVGDGDAARAWSKALWELVDVKKPSGDSKAVKEN